MAVCELSLNQTSVRDVLMCTAFDPFKRSQMYLHHSSALFDSWQIIYPMTHSVSMCCLFTSLLQFYWIKEGAVGPSLPC